MNDQASGAVTDQVPPFLPVTGVPELPVAFSIPMTDAAVDVHGSKVVACISTCPSSNRQTWPVAMLPLAL